MGNGGSGKSTFARKLAQKTGLPLIHLDVEYWRPGWDPMSKDEWRLRVSELVKGERWIMDGNFNRTIELRLQKADTVIYLDYNRMVCLLRWLKRVITNWGKSRSDMGPGCNEWFDPEFAAWIWKFNRCNRARYYALLDAQIGITVHIFRNPRQLKRFLKTL